MIESKVYFNKWALGLLSFAIREKESELTILFLKWS